MSWSLDDGEKFSSKGTWLQAVQFSCISYKYKRVFNNMHYNIRTNHTCSGKWNTGLTFLSASKVYV